MSGLSTLHIQRAGKPIGSNGLTRIRTADTFLTRLIGLLSRSSIGSEEGLLIVPCASIHTFFMRFTIDLVFLDNDNKVLGVKENVKPNRISLAPKGTYAVLEIAQGNVMRTGIHLDDTLIFD
ncbi:MAG: hypothetical protein CSH49_09090 [Alcanivorax sp.]|jgi:uncharacterized protein|uniref:DUF192 domain-containing protein n=1 Tax=unclassified Ketobacter TaxID=2639109 RepID=UPI000E7F0666|nr:MULTISPECIES: DUF192 domain-containing protein [unclassified Ketobacter]RLT88991.1 MAG: DUF192 domain-containing protein [Ketobacter sp. GenoA1]RLT97130.1 MAG: DUF192 domain-containing protein [Ketobacter sp.]TNC89023.1 MAG: hypothetical protein CSH49_09090 [Alcanivorax sp.]HAU16661.1 hypothetical protein [Gammaproteobacteria bacterium]|tara:strand:+ start:31683 stop:32048 length:366 start_codon:yes stop_codon:yes gene_type:complete